IGIIQRDRLVPRVAGHNGLAAESVRKASVDLGEFRGANLVESGATSNGAGRTVRLMIPARAEYIALCRLALTGISRLRAFPEEVLEDLKLALTEACTNSVRHAYGEAPGSVEIVYELHPDRLVIEVSDEGTGFDP